MNEKGKFGYIFVIWMLVFIIVILFFLYFSGFLYSANPNQVSNLPLGTTSKISLKENQAFSISFDLNGEILPNEKLPQNINILNIGDEDIFVRAKSYINTLDQGVIDMPLKTGENWAFYEGYYYFNGKVLKEETVALATHVIVNEEYGFSKKEKYIVNILVESISSTLNIEDMWGFNLNLE